MKRVTLRLIYPASVSQQHVDAAEAGLKPFRRFGALVESVCADDKDAFDGVRYPKSLRQITSASGKIRLDRLPKGIFDGFGIIFGIALTPYRMIKPDGEGMTALSGSSGYMRCAAVSLDKLSDPESSDMLIAIVKREAGRLFIRGQQDCPEKCIMQGASGFQDFVTRFMVSELDFCGICGFEIEEKIRRLSRA